MSDAATATAPADAGATTATTQAAAPAQATAVTAQTTTTQAATPAAWHSDWLKPDGSINHASYERLPDNLKSLAPSLANAKSIDDVFSKLHNLSTLAGKKALAPLPADAPPEAVAERHALMRTINGVPEKPEGYAIAKPEDLPDFAWNQQAYDTAAAIAHKHNISPAAMKELVESQVGATKQQIETLKADETKFFADQDAAFKDSLKKDGLNYEKSMDMATRAAQKFGLDVNSPLFKYAEVRLALSRAGLATMEPGTVTGQSTAPAGQDFSAMAQDVISNKANPHNKAYWDANHPQNKAVKEQVIAWQAEAARVKQAQQQKAMIRPLRDLIVIQPLPGAGMVGLIHIPDISKSTKNQTFHRAKVIYAGKECGTVKQGDAVLVSEYFGDRVVEDDKEMKIGRERDIVGVVSADKVIAVGNRVLAEPIKPNEKIGSILLPEDMRSPQITATVISAGPDCEVRPGAKIIVPRVQCLEVWVANKLMILVGEDQVLATA